MLSQIKQYKRTFKSMLSACVAASICVGLSSDSMANDPGSYIGINCGNSGRHMAKNGMEKYFIKRNIAALNLAHSLGIGWARIGGGNEQWYPNGKMNPQAFETVINHANSLGIKCYLFAEYRGDHSPVKIRAINWREAGRTFAEYYGERVACYGLINEVDHTKSPHPPADIAWATEEFAEGVHSVNPAYLVSSPSIGGTPMEIERANGFLRAMAPLFESGKLQVLNLHSYHDSRPHKPHYSNIDRSSRFAPTRNFLRAKDIMNVKTPKPILYAAGEFNYRNWSGTDEDRAIGFMTAFWDQLMVVESTSSNKRVGLFMMPYNIPDSRAKRETTMADKYEWKEDGSFQYYPNEKGFVLQESLKLTKGMSFIYCDPHDRGIAILRGNSKKAWVWHNRVDFSSLYKKAKVTLSGIPRNGKHINIHRWDSSADKPFKTITTHGKSKLTLDVADLPQDQTIVLVVNSDKDGGVKGSLD